MDAMDKPEMDMDMDADKDAEGDVEDRVVDLEDALDELKAEFEAMMGKKDGEEEKEEESLAPEVAPELTPEVEMEAKHAKKDKEDMKEYKNPVKADKGGAAFKADGKNIAQGGEESGRAAPTAQKMTGDFENSPGKDKGTSMKKEVKPQTADGSDKSAKSPVVSRK